MAEIRPEREGDQAGIRAVHLAAFPSSAEAALVDALVSDGDVIASLVAVSADRVIGHVLCSRMTVEGDGQALVGAGVAPLAVVPEWQRKGLGTRLMQSAVRAMADKGVEIAFLLGEPEYYRRFGFDPRVAAPFSSPYAGPYFMALALCDGFKLPERGRAEYAGAFARLETQE